MSKPRMIQCPHNNQPWHNTIEAGDCEYCHGNGEFPDRRSPTAAERAVKRIKDIVHTPAVHMTKFGPGAASMALWVIDIIREETERDLHS